MGLQEVGEVHAEDFPPPSTLQVCETFPLNLNTFFITRGKRMRWHYLHTLGFRRPRKVQEFGPCYHWINVVIGSAFGCVCRRGFPSQSTSHDAMGFEYLLTNFFLAGNTPEQIAGLFRKWALAHLDNTSATMCDHNNLLPFPSIALTLLFQILDITRGPDKLNSILETSIEDTGQMTSRHEFTASTIGQPVTDSLVTNLQSIKTSKQIQQLTFDAQG
ncbi:hypothetical protein R6Q59_035508 [Mikania micrantha]